MSQIYKVQLSNSIVRTIHASDEMRHRVELTPILDEAAMRELLKQSLIDNGWQETEDGKLTKQGPSGETLVWDLESNEVIAGVEVEKDVSAEVSATGWGESDASARRDAQRSINRQAARAEAEIDETRQSVQRQIGDSLESGEQQRQEELNRVLQRVYSEALKKKAEQLGTVVSVDENDQGDDYELVIKIAE